MKWMPVCMVSALCLGLLGCPTNTPLPVKTPPVTPKPVAQAKPLRIGLALGGGAAKGFSHIGVIKMLAAQGIKVDMVAGTSAGAVVGAIYAGTGDAYQLQKIAMSLDKSELSDWKVPFSGNGGVLKGEKLQNFINQKVGNRTLQNLKIPFAAVATNLATGERIVFRSGNTGLAVRASAAIPNVFEPVVIGKQTYVDGGLSSPVPVSALKEMGANFVIAVDISAKPTAEKSSGFFAVFDQTFNIMSLSALKQELAQADVVIRPNVLSHSSTDFDDREKSILEGEQITQSQMVAIKKAIAAKQAMLSR